MKTLTNKPNLSILRFAAILLIAAVLASCKPREIPVACTPLPIVDGFETAMTEGGKMRLRVPRHTSWLTEDCKQIKGVELRYYWHKGELIWNDGTQPITEFSKETLSHPVIIYLREFKLLSEVAPVTLNPWQFEGAVRHYKYPLEFYPKFYWAGPDQPPVTAHPNKVWGVVGTHSPILGFPFTTLCGIVPRGNEAQTSLVNGDFPKDTVASCRGGLAVVKGDKVAFGLVDVWANNAHDIDKIYNATISQIQTYIQE